MYNRLEDSPNSYLVHDSLSITPYFLIFIRQGSANTAFSSLESTSPYFPNYRTIAIILTIYAIQKRIIIIITQYILQMQFTQFTYHNYIPDPKHQQSFLPFLQLLTNSLRKSFHDFCLYNQYLEEKNQQQNHMKELSKTRKVIIEIMDDQEEVRLHNQKNINVEVQKVQQDTPIHKKTQYITDESLIDSYSNKKNVLNDQKMEIEDTGNIQAYNEQYVVDAQISCPSIGLKYCQITKKRNSLISRNIKDWSQLKKRGRKPKFMNNCLAE